jgi:putative transposase
MSSGIYNKQLGYLNRRSIRLRGYDYSQTGVYFVTICIHHRDQQLFGDVVDGKMVLNECGAIVQEEWHNTAKIRSYVVLDEFVVMPNHFHGIIQLTDRRGTACRAPLKPPPDTNKLGTASRAQSESPSHCDHQGTARRAPTDTPTGQFGKPTNGSIPTIVRAFKSVVSNRIHEKMPEFKWQRNYYEHIVRDDKSLFLIRQYIRNNPLAWASDSENHVDREIKNLN